MSDRWTLSEDESIVDCVVPSDDPWDLPLCAECGQVAYRVMLVAAAGIVKRKVPLCGRHFIIACLRVPELNKFNRGGKSG
jgi:hypothetical protein